MFFELIAAIAAGFAAAGAVLVVNKASGGRLPRWAMPVAAGAAMIGFGIWSEYSWFGRTVASLPPDVVVTTRHEAGAPWRPWTYLWPITDRFAAYDPASLRTNPAVPDQRMVEMMFFGRWQPARIVPMVVDCAGQRGAPLLDSVTFDESGAVDEAGWAPIPADDPTLISLCKEV